MEDNSQNTSTQAFQELLTKEGAPVEGINKVLFQGVIAYQKLTFTTNNNARLTARVYIPIETRDGRKRFGYNIQAWGDIAQALNQLQPGTPIRVHGQVSTYSWNDQATGKKMSKTDVKVTEFFQL